MCFVLYSLTLNAKRLTQNAFIHALSVQRYAFSLKTKRKIYEIQYD